MKRSALILIILLAFGYLVAVNAHGPEQPGRYSLHQVRPGETLWGISERYMPDVDPRQGVEWIDETNGLKSAVIRPGDILNVPDWEGPLIEPLGPEYSSKEAAMAAEKELQKIFQEVGNNE